MQSMQYNFFNTNSAGTAIPTFPVPPTSPTITYFAGQEQVIRGQKRIIEIKSAPNSNSRSFLPAKNADQLKQDTLLKRWAEKWLFGTREEPKMLHRPELLLSESVVCDTKDIPLISNKELEQKISDKERQDAIGYWIEKRLEAMMNSEPSDEEDQEQKVNEDNYHDYYYLAGGKPYNTLEECPPGMLATRQCVLAGGKRPNKQVGKEKRRSKRPNQRRRNKRKHMDCSPGNVYESSALLTTSSTGTIDLLIALNNPQQIFPSTQAIGAQDLADNWDAYSVERVSMSTQMLAPLTARQGEWTVVVDHDSPPPTTTLTQALMLTYTRKRTWSSEASPHWSVSPNKISQAEYISGIGADPEPAVIIQKGKYDWKTPPANGFMYVKLAGGPSSTVVGTIYVRVHVTAWFKRRLALTLKPARSLPAPNLPPSPDDDDTAGNDDDDLSRQLALLKLKLPNVKKK